MGQATLMYGIGATKAGTSWLYSYLNAHPECAMPNPKELHYFDKLETGKDAGALASVEERLANMKSRLEQGRGDAGLATRFERLQEWHSILTNPSEDCSLYLDYLNRDKGEARLVGDITPAYALLPVERLRKMATVAPVTKFVYILRDPVARLWSNIRMVAARKVAQKGGDVVRATRSIAKRVLEGKRQEITERSDYAGALARLDAALDPRQLFVDFYENLFGGEALTRLCGFLGIATLPGKTSELVHAGHPVALDGEMHGALARLLAPQYAAVEARFGTLPAEWQRNMVKA